MENGIWQPCLEWVGLEPPLDIVTVAGETLGGADRLTEGEARADRIPPEDKGMLPARLSGRPGDTPERSPGERLFRGRPGEILERTRAGEWATALLSLAAVLPLVAARLLLLLPPPPPPGGGPGASNSVRHFFTRFLARLARSLSEDLRRNSFMCFPSLVAWNIFFWKIETIFQFNIVKAIKALLRFYSITINFRY